MAEIRHGTGSAISVSSNKKGGIKKQSKSKKENRRQQTIQEDTSNMRHNKKKMPKGLIIIIEIVILIVIVYIMWIIYRYAIQNKCGSVFWNYISDSGIQIICGSVVDAIVSLIIAYIIEKKIVGIIWWQIFLGFLALISAFFCFFTYSKIKGAINQQKETLVIEENTNKMPEIATQSGESLQSDQRVVKYLINQDLFMSNKSLEDYYAGEISEENQCIVMAEILLGNLENNIPVGSKSENYNKLLETADKEYDTYMYQRNRDKDSETENDTLFSDRIDMLQKSLEKREEAHKEFESPENERPLANGYKDMGDEYFGKGRQSDAIIVYEESSGWYMRAIYHAAAIGAHDEMKKCMELFEKLGGEVEKLNEIDPNRRGEIKKVIEAYGIFVDKVSENAEQ